MPFITFNVGFEDKNGAAGIFNIQLRSPFRSEQLQSFVNFLHDLVLKKYVETQSIQHLDRVLQDGNACFGHHFHLAVDENLVDLPISRRDSLFNDWFDRENVDLIFTISVRDDYHSISFHSEGSQEELATVFKNYGMCV